MTHRTNPETNEQTQHRAKSLRRDSTYPERLLWSRLRARRTAGLKFRRQVPVGSFVIDFYCERLRLAVEVDGESHGGRAAQDAARTERLKVLGITVIRVTNDDVLHDLDAVLEYIVTQTARLQSALTPSPSPGGRGEQDDA